MRPRLACDVVQATWIEDQHGFADEVLPESEKLRDQQWRVGPLVFVEYGDGILIFGNADDLEIAAFRRIRSEYGEILLSRIEFVEWPTKSQIVGEKPFKAILGLAVHCETGRLVITAFVLCDFSLKLLHLGSATVR